MTISNNVIPFPPRGPFCVRIVRDAEAAWLVICRDHGWLHADRRDAIEDATAIAATSALPSRWRHEGRIRALTAKGNRCLIAAAPSSSSSSITASAT